MQKKTLALVNAFEGGAPSSVIKIPNISKTFKSIEKMLTVKEDQFPKIAASIESGSKGRYIYRGMSMKELRHILSHKEFICPAGLKKQHHYNIAEHVVINNNSKFISFTPSLALGVRYASTGTVIPTSGAILETNLPPFFINSKEILATHPELYQRYQKRQERDKGLNDAVAFMGTDGVVETTLGNSEITMINKLGKIYVGLGMHDIRAAHILTVPGKMLHWISIKTPVHETCIENPEFKPRVCSVKVGFTENDNFLEEEFELVNQRNREMELIPPDARVITMHEAKYIAQSGLLDLLNDMFDIDETHIFSHVPSSIPINDKEALMEHMVKTIQSLSNVTKRESRVEEITDEPSQSPKTQ
ncbi:hypothetical protein [Legionella tucsonensis]|uniref:hypothetical protein n=1 Tax=Legionella tucsonensis TaxID=40335 RepID=UPI0007306672|nr:hypothetical protein [Legionella tucsonensis]